MGLELFINKISFKFVKPEKKLPRWFFILVKVLNKFGIRFESFNTRFPSIDPSTKSALKEILNIPRMSTVAIGAVINKGVRQMPSDQIFLNIGVWNGFTFLSGIINNQDKKSVGVDNFSEFGGDKIRQQFIKRFNKFKSKNHLFYDMDYEEYFSKVHKGLIGFYIYDGEHSYKNQLKGLKLAEPFFASDCIILVDDTNADAPHRATLDFIAQSTNKYKVIFDQKTSNNGHPTWWNGLMVIQKI